MIYEAIALLLVTLLFSFTLWVLTLGFFFEIDDYPSAVIATIFTLLLFLLAKYPWFGASLLLPLGVIVNIIIIKIIYRESWKSIIFIYIAWLMSTVLIIIIPLIIIQLPLHVF